MKQYPLYENPYGSIAVDEDTVFQVHRLDISGSDLGPYLNNFSPFVVKLEAYVRMFDVPHAIAVQSVFDDAPRGKLPFISVGDVRIADSDLIVHYFKTTLGNPDAHLTAGQRAIGHLVQRTLEDHLYWIVLYYEFFDQAGWDILLRANVGDPSALPPEIRTAVDAGRDDFRQRCYDQGIARYTPDEIVEKARKDLAAISEILGDNRYLLGTDQPTSFDAILVGFAQAFFQVRDMHPEITDYARSIPNLGRYMQRMLATYFPELEQAFKPA